MQRGDLITVALQGDAGKPRPALVIQADHFANLPTLIYSVCGHSIMLGDFRLLCRSASIFSRHY
jgi:hypothetical protein